MKSSILTTFLFSLFIAQTYLQNPQPIPTDQNFIDPTVVNSGTPQPAIPTNDQPQQPPVNNQQPSQTLDNNQRPPQQGVLLSNANLPGLEGEAIPIDQAQINEAINNPKPRLTEQAMAKAKQQAEKARQMADYAKRQAQSDRKTRDKQQDEQLRKIQFDQTLSKTQKKKQQERLMFRKTSRSVEQGTRFTQYLFEQGLGASQFFIKIPAAQQVALNLYTYVSQDNTYVRTKNIEEEEPVKIYIYENNQNIVHEGEFYYQSYIIFQGQANAMYLIKIVNNGRTKLISMNTKKLVQETHLEETLQKQDGKHVQRTQNLAIQISRWHQEFRKIRMLDFQDLKSVQGFIEKYYSWELIQSLVAIVLCIFQVKMIQNMFKGNSIV